MLKSNILTLKSILKANSASCIIFGCLFVFMPSQVLDFLSQSQPAPKWLLISLGIGLILNGFHLLWASLRQVHNKNLIRHFAISDFLWVAASVLLVITGLWITTSSGIIATFLVAVMVGIFGLLQFQHLNQID